MNARSLLESGDKAGALKEINAAIGGTAKAPADYHLLRAGILRDLGEDDQALPDLDRAIALDAKNAQAYAMRASIYLARRDDGRAEADIRAPRRSPRTVSSRAPSRRPTSSTLPWARTGWNDWVHGRRVDTPGVSEEWSLAPRRLCRDGICTPLGMVALEWTKNRANALGVAVPSDSRADARAALRPGWHRDRYRARASLWLALMPHPSVECLNIFLSFELLDSDSVMFFVLFPCRTPGSANWKPLSSLKKGEVLEFECGARAPSDRPGHPAPAHPATSRSTRRSRRSCDFCQRCGAPHRDNRVRVRPGRD